jgi:hypothetical protein
LVRDREGRVLAELGVSLSAAEAITGSHRT